MADRHFFLLAVIVYGLSMAYSVFLWRKGFRKDDRVNYFLLLAAFALHVVAMAMRGFSLKQCPVNNIYEATIFITWTIVTSYLLVGLWPKLRFLGAFASPILFALGVFALMPSLDPPRGPQPNFSNGLTSLHAATSLLAYGAFGLGATAAGMFLTQQHDLKFRKLRAVLSLLPPIQRLEFVTVLFVGIGFVLFTVGLVAGGLLPHTAEVPYWKETKVLWSGLLWLIYGGLLAARLLFSASRKFFAVASIAAFVFLLLTFWGTTLLSPIHNQ